MVVLSGTGDKSGSGVLNRLELFKSTLRYIVQKRVVVVEFGRHNKMNQDLGGFCGYEFPSTGDVAQIIRG